MHAILLETYYLNEVYILHVEYLDNSLNTMYKFSKQTLYAEQVWP